jgi:hypothetical protein
MQTFAQMNSDQNLCSTMKQEKIMDEDEIFYFKLITPLLTNIENGLNFLEKEEEEDTRREELFYYAVMDSIQKFFLVLKWPPWTKYNTSVISKEEWEEKVSKRKKALRIFCTHNGIPIILRLMKLLDSKNRIGLVVHCLNVLIWCAYESPEQKFLIEKGILLYFNISFF